MANKELPRTLEALQAKATVIGRALEAELKDDGRGYGAVVVVWDAQLGKARVFATTPAAVARQLLLDAATMFELQIKEAEGHG